MPLGTWLKAGSSATALVLAMAGAATAATTPAGDSSAARAAAVTLRYDDSRAAGWEAAIAAGVASWNANVSNVRLVEAAPGAAAEIVIVATTGWPQATLGPVRPGRQVRVELGSQAVDQGYNKTRIAAHELGHSLGLPDTKPGPCSQLMSGSSAGTACTNATPNATERSRVQSAYASAIAALAPTDGRTLVDAP
ncbi:snapalysin family zinc-dependent metalloprotease [Streptomyces griseoviridis]|jgi:snapalysin|uniref:Extracellular small neutral protease n=3 Tax=Streptomyces TaxID=1883 RepID=A0A918LKZ8_STRGD|nr:MULTISPECIES: snapalysin family zinc-dependent metalloprotease [Streptomyces]MDP9679751.1 snapalysin [Streptomyces griseoviridis]GGS67719.1 peptidase [Streptomyces niveoruber]GGT22121.1 peptidase [Streptomyces griseoviridis]GGU63757.1 peptidase [Streptomyces daghestanicus]GHI30024.1 peptidase [Streptomyces daghestanicus]